MSPSSAFFLDVDFLCFWGFAGETDSICSWTGDDDLETCSHGVFHLTDPTTTYSSVTTDGFVC